MFVKENMGMNIFMKKNVNEKNEKILNSCVS